MELWMVLVIPAVAAAQTPVPPSATPETTRVGVTIFADYTLTDTPKVTDASGRQVTVSGFNLTRSYINVTGSITPRITFRVTPDITRNSDPTGATSGNVVFRLKYAFAQFRAGTNTLFRFGMQPTPMIDGQESVYRYRFQGTPFVEREGGLSSSDLGLTMIKPLPSGFGEVHVGVYNGETYTKPEVNDQKAYVGRVTLRPLRNHDLLKGLRLLGYYHYDRYAKGQSRDRASASAMFEHARFNAGVDWAQRTDQPTPASLETTGRGMSFFVTPFFKEKGNGPEALIRFDTFKPDVNITGRRNRLIAGLAYWFPKQGAGTAALLAHMEQVRQSTVLTSMKTTERRFTLNMLITF
jgi:hypothetical protein